MRVKILIPRRAPKKLVARPRQRSAHMSLIIFLTALVGTLYALLGDSGLMSVMRMRARAVQLQYQIMAKQQNNQQLRDTIRPLREKDPAAIEKLAREQLFMAPSRRHHLRAAAGTEASGPGAGGQRRARLTHSAGASFSSLRSSMARFGVFGWGVVAPKSRNIDAFAANLELGESWLTAFDGFGPSTFLAGNPEFDFNDYRSWVEERFPPSKFPQLKQKMGCTTLYSLGAFIQALGQNPGIEQTLQELGPQTHVLVGTGVGDLPTQYEISLELRDAQRRWNRFWASPERNADRADFETAGADERVSLAAKWGIPADPRELPEDSFERETAYQTWDAFWMSRSPQLGKYLDEFEAIEAEGIDNNIDASKLRLIRKKRNELGRLQKKWQCPDPPWLSVSPNLIWNIANTPAAQVSMMGKITGPSLRADRRLLVLRCRPQAGDAGHRNRRRQSRGRWHVGPGAPSHADRRLLQGACAGRRPAPLAAAHQPSWNAYLRWLGAVDRRRLRLHDGAGV